MDIREQAQKIADSIDRPIGIKYTPDGEIVIRRVQGVDVEQPLRDDGLLAEFGNLPLSEDEKNALCVLDEAIRQIKVMGRTMPVTVKEMVGWKVKKKTLVSLEKYALIRMVLTSTYNTDNGRVKGLVNIVFPTIQGRAYIKEKLYAEDCN